LPHEIKILHGELKGKTIQTLKGKKYRPTMEMVRMSLFNTLRSFIQDSLFLELFAGSGIIGFEALSMGAKKVVFVENYLPAVKLLKINAKRLGLEGRVEVYNFDVFKFLSKNPLESFDVIFMDPPYELGPKIKDVLELLSINKWLKSSGIIVVEHHKKIDLPERVDKLNLINKKIFGETLFSYYKME